jgi:hypothetical protein
MISESQKFQKWQWISVRIEKSRADHRPESHKIYVDTIEVGGKVASAGNWNSRRPWWEKLPTFDNFKALDAAREREGISLGILRPKQLVKLEISPVESPEWTEEEMAKLLQQQSQGDLFSQEEQRTQLKRLEKLPFDFYYHYICDTPDGEQLCRHKIVDWEVGQFYRTCKRDYGGDWERQFRAKLQDDFSKKDLLFMMGNIHRFQHQWLIISLLYPPKLLPSTSPQASLF